MSGNFRNRRGGLISPRVVTLLITRMETATRQIFLPANDCTLTSTWRRQATHPTAEDLTNQEVSLKTLAWISALNDPDQHRDDEGRAADVGRRPGRETKPSPSRDRIARMTAMVTSIFISATKKSVAKKSS
jgi:hypothetical protein